MYVCSMLIIGHMLEKLCMLKKEMKKSFAMKDMRLANIAHELKISHNRTRKKAKSLSEDEHWKRRFIRLI